MALDLAALRRKLAALDYPCGDLDERAGPLVQRLLGDLLRVTEGFQAQKHDLIRAHHQVDDYHTQVRGSDLARILSCLVEPALELKSCSRSRWLQPSRTSPA